MSKVFLGLFLLFSLQIYAQGTNGASGGEKVFRADFSETDKSRWPLMNTQYYFFLIEGGRYRMECKAEDKKAYLLPQDCPQLESYRAEARLTLEKDKQQKGSAGLALSIQSQLRGGYLFEINRDRQYRVVEIDSAGNQHFLSRSGKKEGWVENKSIAKAGRENRLKAVQSGGSLEFYVNDTRVFRLNGRKPMVGMSGLYIAGISRASADEFELYRLATSSSDKISANALPESTDSATVSDLSKLTTAYMDCRRRTRELEVSGQGYKEELQVLRKKQDELQRYIRDNLDTRLRAQMEKQARESEALRQENERLQRENAELQEFKATIQSSSEGDQVILYAEKYKAEQEKNARLQERIKRLEEELKAARNPAKSKPIKKNSK